MFHRPQGLTRILLAIAMVATIAACSKSDPSKFIVSGKAFADKGDYRAAIVEFKNAIQGAPNNAEARFLLARTLLDSGDAIGAETEVRKALDLRYEQDQTYPLLARAMLAQGKFQMVVTEFSPVKLSTTQGRSDLATSLAIAYAGLGNYKTAGSTVDSVLAEVPGDARALVVKAQIVASSLRDLPEAGRLIDLALAAAPNDKDALLAKAQLLVTQNKRDEAIAALEQTLDKYPELRPARISLISLLVGSGNTDSASRQLAKLKAVAPNEAGTAYADALVSFAAGNPTRARELTQKLLSVQPDHLPSLYLSGLIFAQLNSYAAAEEALRKVLARVPDDIGARKILAGVYVRSGQPALALETLQPIMTRYPDDPELQRMAGEAALSSGDFAKGRTYYERAAALDKTSVSSRVRLAQVRMATGDTQRAFKDLEDLAQSDASQNQADLALILAHVQRREYDKALAAIDALDKKQPENTVTGNLRGGVYLARRDYKNARVSFEKALAVQPKNVTAATSLAALDIQDGKIDDARKRYQQMLEKDPNNETLLIALAELTAFTSDKPEESKALLERAITANPASSRPRLALISYYVRIGDSRAALSAAQQALAAFPNDPQVIDAMGSAQLASGDLNQAISTYTKLTQVQPQNAGAVTRLAALQVQARDYPGAIESARKALAVSPEFVQALDVLVRAQILSGQSAAALADARKLQKEQPDRALGFALEGEIHVMNKKWSDAAASLRQALAKQANSGLAAVTYQALQNAGNAKDATAFADTWMRDHPRDTTLQEMMAQQFQARKEYPAAVAKYRAVLEINPDSPISLNNLAWILGENGDPKAREYAERAYRQAPFNASVIDTYGWTLFRTGDTARGVQLLRFASNVAPSDNDIRMHLAQGLLKTGDKEGAKRVLAPLTKLDAGAPLRIEAEKMLAGG